MRKDTFEHSFDSNNKLKKNKRYREKERERFVWFGMKVYIHKKVFNDYIFTIEHYVLQCAIFFDCSRVGIRFDIGSRYLFNI